MSDSDEFVTEDETPQQTGSGLRAKLEAALAELSSVKKQYQELQSKETERATKATWDELKVPAPIREFYKGEQTPEAMKAWWENSKGFFNIEAVEDKPEEQQETPEQAEQREAAQQFQDASSVGTDSLNKGFSAALAKAQEAKSAVGTNDFAARKKEFYALDGTPAY